MSNPKECQINSSSCGNYLPYPNRLGCVKLKDLKKDVGSIFLADVEITECDLICMRSGIPLNRDGLICAKHQFTLGTDYKPSTRCKYAEHPPNSKSKGNKLSWQLYEFVKKCDSSFILGSRICKPCQTKISMKRNSYLEDDVTKDPNYIPEAFVADENENLKKRVQLDALTNILETERVRYQVSSDIQTMSAGSLNYFRTVHKSWQKNLTDTFCRLIAPGQEQQMKNALESEQKMEIQTDAIALHLKEAYDSCATRKARRSVLMLIPKTYSKSNVVDLLGCSIYDVERARAILKLYGTCEEEPKKERLYSRLSFEKAQHFINFLFSTGLLQEVAYGTTKLKFESGDAITIGSTILNGIYEHSVKEYKIYCKEINYDSLGSSTLRNMLHKMKPHTRKKLAGIDTFVVEGIEAFESLRLCVKLVGNNDETKKLLNFINRAESYLKARYRTHCQNDDSCISHCIDHALSHPKDTQLFSKCDKIHDSICGECLNMVNCIASLKQKLTLIQSRHEREVAQYEVNNSEAKIMEWQRHILRGVQQSKARSDAFSNLGPTSSLWIRDFAQKYNPTKTLEGMHEYFGKRGMTVSVEVFITKSFMSYQKLVYLVALDKCDQSCLETLCIADVVLDIKRIQLKSDNAGNYHANGVAECMFKLGQKRNIIISAYDYNEAQLGKDQCDREAAVFKSCAERWLLQKETHKISTAKELVHALFSGEDLKNTKMCVLEIDKTLTKLENVRNITNISYYHSVEFQDKGALYREYYNVGKGKFHEYNEELKFINGASRVVDWTSSARQSESMNLDSRNKYQSFTCPETLCVLSFRNENEMIAHVASGSHQYVKTKTGMDKAILYYAQQKHVQNALTIAATPDGTDNIDESNKSHFSQIYTQGWARKVRRIRKITPKQKEFIEQLFKNGAATNAKLSAEQMFQKMKDKMVDGDYYFSPDEYMEPSRIRSLISRLKKQEKKPESCPKTTRKLLHISEDDGIELNIEDICDSVLDSDVEDN